MTAKTRQLAYDLEDQTFMANSLAKRRSLALPALQGEHFVLRERDSGMHQATERFFASNGFAPENWLELGSNEAIKKVSVGHLSVAVISRHALRAEDLARDLCLLPVTGLPTRSQWHVVHPRARQLSSIACAFREHPLEQARRWPIA